MPDDMQPPAPQPKGTGQPIANTTAVFELDMNKAAATCYLPFLPLAPNVLWLMTEPAKNKELRFHAYQGLGVLIIAFVLSMVAGVIGWFAGIPVIGPVFAFIDWLLHFIILVVFFLGNGFLAYKAYQGEKVVLPYIGQMAQDRA